MAMPVGFRPRLVMQMLLLQIQFCSMSSKLTPMVLQRLSISAAHTARLKRFLHLISPEIFVCGKGILLFMKRLVQFIS